MIKNKFENSFILSSHIFSTFGMSDCGTFDKIDHFPLDLIPLELIFEMISIRS